MDENPYLSPTTMPDGSTRRPIVERVEEIRKAAGISHPSPDVMIGEYETDLIFWHDRDDAVGHLPRPVVALALCRVAVEDWLIEIGSKKTTIGERLFLGRFTRILGGGGYKAAMNIAPCTEFSDGHTTQEAESTSIHAALNAAAHAVADALGVAP